MDLAICSKCGRAIPEKRTANAKRVGAVASYCSKKCQNAAKQARHRQRTPGTAQDRIHFRNLAAHGMIAEKLLRDPRVLNIARDNLKRWSERNGLSPAMGDWNRLIDGGDVHAVITALLRVDEEGMRLRSSSPFAGALDKEERELLYRSVRK